MNTQDNQQKSLEILINAVQVATKRGAFELAETEIILQAVKTFTTPKQETPNVPPDVTEAPQKKGNGKDK